MKIEIWSDYSCPFCYIGKTHLDKALKELKLTDDVNVVVRAFQLDPLAPKETSETTAAMLALKYGVTLQHATKMVDDVAAKAKRSGITMKYEKVKPTNTFDAHRVMKAAKDKGQKEALMKALFKGYFEDGLNLSDHDVLENIAKNCGLDVVEVKYVLKNDSHRDEVESDLQYAKKLGIRGVPYFLIDSKTIINGAQSVETFIETIRKAYIEEKNSREL